MKRNKKPKAGLLTSAIYMLAGAAYGFEIETGNPDWSLRWDNTVRASTKFRTEKAESSLKDSFRQVPTGAPPPAPASFSFPQALNFNAGDQNFQDRGLVSARFDVLSEFDAIWKKDFGLRISGAGWYDDQLHHKTDADNDPTIGQNPPDKFPSRTKRIAGGDAEFLDAFVFGGWRFENGMKLTARLGKHALQYGESLFFGDNAIARAQGPIDIDKLLAAPNAQFKEIIRPVPQLSAQLQLSPTVSVGGYYQFKWEEDRLPPAGSYFSSANIPWGSGQPQFVSIGSTNYVLTPGNDREPKDSGQFGLQLKWRVGETDLGFYAVRYHDKGGQLYGQFATPPTQVPSVSGGNWFYKFPGGIKAYGVSASHSVGDFNLAAEGSIRDDMPLRSTNMLFGFFPGQARPQLAKGRTAHLNLSSLATFGPSFIARESSVLAEIAWNRVLHKDDPENQIDPGRTRDATAIQMIFTPTYRQALPGLDLSVPMGIRYTLDGHSSVTAWDAEKSGSANIGIEGNYIGLWQFALTYTHYIGGAVPFVDYSPLLEGGSPVLGHGNNLADRNFVALSLRRTF